MKLREEVSIFEGLPQVNVTPSTAMVPIIVAAGAATNTTRITLGNYRKALWHFEITTASPSAAGTWVGNQGILLHAMNALTAAATPATLHSVEVVGGQNMLACDIGAGSALAGHTIEVNDVTFTCHASPFGPTSPLWFQAGRASQLSLAINGQFTDLEATSDGATLTTVTVADVGNTTIDVTPSTTLIDVRTRWVCADIEVEAQELNQDWPFVFARLQNGNGTAASPASGLSAFCVALKSGSVYKPGHNVAAARG